MSEPSVEFDYDAVDHQNPLPSYDFTGIVELNHQVWEWVYQQPCKDMEGFFCRAIFACWIFVPDLRACTMTEIAGRFGKKKQSLGRFTESFLATFPQLKSLQHFKAE